VIEVFTRSNDIYPYCAILRDKIEVIPEIKEITGSCQVYSTREDKTKLYANIDKSLLVNAPLNFSDLYIDCFLNEKPVSYFGIDYSYLKLDSNTILISLLQNQFPFEETLI